MKDKLLIVVLIAMIAAIAITSAAITKQHNSEPTSNPDTSTTVSSDDTITATGEILCYNPQTREVGDGVAAFTRSNPREAEPFCLYLMGIEEPDKIEVKDWKCVSKEYVDSGMVRLTLFNENSSFWAVKEGYVFYDGQEIVKLLDDTEY